MGRLNYRKLKEGYAADPQATRARLIESAEGGGWSSDDWSIQESFAELAGYSALRRARSGGLIADILKEDAVVSGIFSTIASAALSTKVRDAYKAVTNIFTPLVPVIPSRLKNETIPGITQIGDQAGEIPEKEEYPMVGVSEDYIEAGPTRKHGMILALTRESILFDRTGILLERARQIGEWLGYKKEKRIVLALLDARAGTPGTEHKYRWKGTSYATYASSGGHGIVNLQTAALVDYTDIQAAEILMANMTDPDTGEPMVVLPKHLIVGQTLAATAARIVNAIKVEQGAISASVPVTHSPSPVGATLGLGVHPYQLIVSTLLESEMSASGTDWFLGDVSKLLAYVQNWPLTQTMAPPNSHDEFHRDIVQQFKASERGVVVTMDPHYMVCSKAS